MNTRNTQKILLTAEEIDILERAQRLCYWIYCNSDDGDIYTVADTAADALSELIRVAEEY